MSPIGEVAGRTSGIDSVRSRIQQLEQLTGGSPQQGMVVRSVAEFDPFGEAYQQALTRARGGAPAGAAPQRAAGSATATPAATSGWVGQMNGRTTPTTSTTRTGAVATVGAGGMFPGVPDEQVRLAIAGLMPAGVRPVGGYGRMPVPEELRELGNGRIPQNRMVDIPQRGHRLYAPAALSWTNLVAAARADGIEMRITDSYRSYEQQVDLVRRKGLYSEGGLGATPGTSNHGWGLAVDVDVRDPATQEWLQVNGPRFGWVEAVPREPWHWEFRPAQV